MKNKIKIYIARHGETEANVKKIMQGSQTDTPLTQEGKKQAQVLGKALKKADIDIIISSPAQRAKDSADIIAQQTNIKVPITYSGQLQERNMYELDGKPYSIFDTEFKNEIDSFRNLSQEDKFKTSLAGMESDKEVAERLIKYFKELLDKYDNKKLLLVTHGGVMKALLQYARFATYDELPSNSVPPSAYIKGTFDGKNFTILETEGITKAIH